MTHQPDEFLIEQLKSLSENTIYSLSHVKTTNNHGSELFYDKLTEMNIHHSSMNRDYKLVIYKCDNENMVRYHFNLGTGGKRDKHPIIIFNEFIEIRDNHSHDNITKSIEHVFSAMVGGLLTRMDIVSRTTAPDHNWTPRLALDYVTRCIEKWDTNGQYEIKNSKDWDSRYCKDMDILLTSGEVDEYIYVEVFDRDDRFSVLCETHSDDDYTELTSYTFEIPKNITPSLQHSSKLINEELSNFMPKTKEQIVHDNEHTHILESLQRNDGTVKLHSHTRNSLAVEFNHNDKWIHVRFDLTRDELMIKRYNVFAECFLDEFYIGDLTLHPEYDKELLDKRTGELFAAIMISIPEYRKNQHKKLADVISNQINEAIVQVTDTYIDISTCAYGRKYSVELLQNSDTSKYDNYYMIWFYVDGKPTQRPFKFKYYNDDLVNKLVEQWGVNGLTHPHADLKDALFDSEIDMAHTGYTDTEYNIKTEFDDSIYDVIFIKDETNNRYEVLLTEGPDKIVIHSCMLFVEDHQGRNRIKGLFHALSKIVPRKTNIVNESKHHILKTAIHESTLKVSEKWDCDDGFAMEIMIGGYNMWVNFHIIPEFATGDVRSYKVYIGSHQCDDVTEYYIFSFNILKNDVGIRFEEQINSNLEQILSSMNIEPKQSNALVDIINTSIDINCPRTMEDKFLAASEELGELSTEIAIQTKRKDREPSIDGVIGEAIDVSICVLDMAVQRLMAETGITDRDEINKILTEKINGKLNKWVSKYSD